MTNQAKTYKGYLGFKYELWENEMRFTYGTLAMYHARLVNPQLSQRVLFMIRSKFVGGKSSPLDLFEEFRGKMNRAKDVCWYCGKHSDNLHVEHILPKAKGGDERDEGNVALACRDCNESKGTRDFIRWYFDRFGDLPDLELIRIYLKNVWKFSQEQGLMTTPSEELLTMSLPFAPESMILIREELKKKI